MPSRGSSDNELLFQSTLDEIHEILEKYRCTHKILLGGYFYASLHRTQSLKRDSLLQDFLTEHDLVLPDNYPIQCTYYHTGADAKSQIDYWFISLKGDEDYYRGKEPCKLF